MQTSENKIFSESIFPDTTDWNAINWYKAIKYVDKLQKRIYRAVSLNNFRKARGLQRMLMRSNAALLLAIRRVTQENRGKRTPGIDGFRALNNKMRGELFDTMREKNINLHNPKPVNRLYIPK
jgi:RNA-directed DNA polymerase